MSTLKVIQMESLYILIPIAVIFLVVAIRLFFWAVKSGQYDDLDTEAKRILFEDVQPVSINKDKRDKSKS